MRIGLDFDNTIVSYDALFHKIAIEQSLIPPRVPANKVAVREYLRAAGREDAWTELQGYVYGVRMDEALAYEGVIAFSNRASARGHELFIISHRTRYPFIGPQYDLHASARSWIEHHLRSNGKLLVQPNHVFFELTKAEKIGRIAACECDLYIDDLPEILLAAEFPSGIARLLFDPEQHHGEAAVFGLRSFSDWQSLDAYVNAA